MDFFSPRKYTFAPAQLSNAFLASKTIQDNPDLLLIPCIATA